MFFQENIEQSFRSAEVCAPQLENGLAEIDQLAFSCKVKNANRTRHAKPAPFSGAHAPAIIHKQQVCME